MTQDDIAKQLALEKKALALLIQAVDTALGHVNKKHPSVMAAPDVMKLRIYLAALKLRHPPEPKT